jgi:NTE family protein
MGLLQPSWFDRAMGNFSLSWSPAFLLLDLVTRLFSPYQFNPRNHNAVRDVLNASIDFEVLRKALAFSAQSSGNNEVVMAATGIFEPQFECHGHHIMQ